MDIVLLIYIVFMILIAIAILLIFPLLSFLLYKHLKKKGKVQSYVGLALFVLTTFGVIFLAIDGILRPSGFGPENQTADIPQKIGGKLLCNSVYTADHHSWEYNVGYKYIDLKGDTVNFERGSYFGRTWKKDEQISKFKQFLLLKTGAWHGSDRLIILNTQTDSIKVFDIDNKFIEKDSLWKAQRIYSLLDYCCAETFIENISGPEILLKYKFRTNKNIFQQYDERRVHYLLDDETGLMKMTKIE